MIHVVALIRPVPEVVDAERQVPCLPAIDRTKPQATSNTGNGRATLRAEVRADSDTVGCRMMRCSRHGEHHLRMGFSSETSRVDLNFALCRGTIPVTVVSLTVSSVLQTAHCVQVP
jgi:hypothetical protein